MSSAHGAFFLSKDMDPKFAPQRKKCSISCAVIGDCMTGKTWLTMAFAQRRFLCMSIYNDTKFMEQRSGLIAVSERQYILKIFDMSGNHSLREMRTNYYSKSDVIVICSSVTNKTSLDNVKDFWLPEIKFCLAKEERPIILVGCQIELRQHGSDIIADRVTTEEGKRLATELGLDLYMECSAMGLIGVRDVFENVAWSALKTQAIKQNFMQRMKQIKEALSCISDKTSI